MAIKKYKFLKISLTNRQRPYIRIASEFKKTLVKLRGNLILFSPKLPIFSMILTSWFSSAFVRKRKSAKKE